jgi:hypothetical protein
MSKQIFRPGANTFARVSLLVGAFITAIVIAILVFFVRSPFTRVGAVTGVAIEQPVRFNHELHSGVVNIDCQFCHVSAEKTPYGGIPDTHTCMTCHSQIATYSELLEPIRESYANNTPVVWNKVHDIANHVYFNHSIHVNKGVGCETCHGRVDQMPIVWRQEVMTMNWCLDCHQNPYQYLRPVEEVYTMGYQPAGNQNEIGMQLMQEYGIVTDDLSDCAVCHR